MTSYDAFLSYDPADAAWAEGWLLPRLQNAGLKIATADDFVLGCSRLVNVEHMLDDSRHTLCVLSPAWIASEWNNFEALLSQSSDPASLLLRTIPLRRQLCDVPRRIAMLESADFTGSTDRWDRQFQRIVKALGSTLQQSQHAAPMPQPTPPQLGTPEYYQEAQENILVFLASQVDKRADVPRELIGQAVNLDFLLVEDLLEVLEQAGLVKVSPYIGSVFATLTARGRLKALEIIQRRKAEADAKWRSMPPEQAKRAVLQTIYQSQHQLPNDYANDIFIAEVLQMDLQDVRDHMDALEEAGYTKTANSHDGHSAILTGRGRLWLRSVEGT
jgi:hypothetical protein